MIRRATFNIVWQCLVQPLPYSCFKGTSSCSLPRVCLFGVVALVISWVSLGLELAVSVVSVYTVILYSRSSLTVWCNWLIHINWMLNLELKYMTDTSAVSVTFFLKLLVITSTSTCCTNIIFDSVQSQSSGHSVFSSTIMMVIETCDHKPNNWD